MRKRCAGLNIPLFSLKTQKSCGVGEFLDLIPLIDWAKEAGLKILQLLPINDTSMSETEGDGYPYSILSAFALHPIYIHLDSLAPELYDELYALRGKFNRPQLHYGEVYQVKKQLLKRIFHWRGEEDLSSKEFARFFKRSKDHLVPYAAFCHLRDGFGTSNFRKWGKYANYSPLLAEEMCEEEGVLFYYFVQFHLDQQLQTAVAYAQKKGIKLKGDFAMGVHPNSVEAWRFPHYFRWNESMGAPPDFYNKYGQNWGFPPYNWEEIEEEKYYFLKARLKWMEPYFDLVRLDHVLGYFRLWEIPKEEVRGLMGTFYPARGYTKEELKKAGLTNLKRLTEPYNVELPKGVKTQSDALRLYLDEYLPFIENRLFFKRGEEYHPRIDLVSTGSFKALDLKEQEIVKQLFQDYYHQRQEKLWGKAGKKKLKVMQKSTKMEICAEDIGVIPECVEGVLHELKILNLHVQRMPKSFEIEFERTEDFPKMCVCTPSNHDTATLREWWEEDEEKTTHYYQKILRLPGLPPKKLTEELAAKIIKDHLQSEAKIAIFLLQDLLGMSEDLQLPDPKKERINDPAIPSYKWNWRMHIYVEELLLSKSFTQFIAKMVKGAKR